MNIFKKLAIFAAIIVFSASMAYAGLMDRSSKCGFDTGSYIYGPEISASPGAPTGSNWRMYVVADVPYFISDGQAAISMIAEAGTATDFALTADADAGDKDIKSIDELEFYDTGLVIDGGADGVLKISSDGTLELSSADWDISTGGTITNASMSADQISAGNLTIGNSYLSIGTDPADAGTIRLANAASILFEADATGTDVNALQVTAAEVVQLGASGASGVTITPALTCSSSVSATTGTFSGAISATDGTFSGDLSVTGTFLQDALAAKSATTTITLDGTTTGGITIGGTSTGTITLGANGSGATLVNLPATVDMTISGGDFAVTDTADADMVTFTNNTMTTADILTIAAGGARTSGDVIKITDSATTASTIQIDANAQTSGYGFYYGNSGAGLTGAAIRLAITDGAGFTGDYINCYDGGAEDFTVERYGEVTIGGSADADMLTITAGNVEITDGDIDVNDGFIAVNSDEDHSNNFTRDYSGAGTAACVLIDDTNPAGTQIKPALEINSDGTGSKACVVVNHDGDLPTFDIGAGAARTGNIIDIDMTNQEAEKAIAISGAMTGTAGEGVIEIHSTGNIASTASLVRIDADTGTPAGTAGFCLMVDDDSLAQASSYAVEINSASNGALNVSGGVSLFAGVATFTSGIDSNAAVDIDLATNANLVDINHAAELGADDAVVTIAMTDATVETNNMFLMRLAYTDAHEKCDYMVFEDGTGDQLQIGAVGDIVMGGADGTGGKLVTSFEDLTGASEGVAASIVVYTSFVTTDGDGDENALTLADGVKGQVKVFVTAVEGAGGDSYKITPANMNGGTKITFDATVGDGCTMIFDGTSWNIISNNGGTIS